MATSAASAQSRRVGGRTSPTRTRQTPVTVRCSRSKSISSIRPACARSRGLPSNLPSSSQMVSAASTHVPAGRSPWVSTSRAFSHANAVAATTGPTSAARGTSASSILAGRTKGAKPCASSRRSLRGERLARTRSGSLRSRRACTEAVDTATGLKNSPGRPALRSEPPLQPFRGSVRISPSWTPPPPPPVPTSRCPRPATPPRRLGTAMPRTDREAARATTR